MPRTSLTIHRSLCEAVLPQGGRQLGHQCPSWCGRSFGALISTIPLRLINFTGSTAVGRSIANVLPSFDTVALLELGGKAPLIVP